MHPRIQALCVILAALACTKPAWAEPTQMSLDMGAIVIASPLSISGDLTATGTLKGPGTVPVGAIAMWSGDPLRLPEGWLLCDGTGTLSDGRPVPDMRNVFAVGSSDKSDATDYAVVGKSSKQPYIELKLENLPWHDHGGSLVPASAMVLTDTRNVGKGERTDKQRDAALASTKVLRSMATDGFSVPLTLRPPHVLLAFIIYAGR